MARSEEDTVEFDRPPQVDSELFAHRAGSPRVTIGAVSDRGKVRSENQDHYLVVRRTRSQEVVMTNMAREEFSGPVDEAYAIVVADGVGGAAFGGLASQLALRTAWELAGRVVCWIMKLDDLDTEEVKRRSEAYANIIQKTFLEEGQISPELAKMGTTWTSAYIVSDHALVAHIGDSRAYLYRDGEAKRLTKDHTLAQDLLDAGLEPEDTMAYSHMLTRCFSGGASNVSPDISHARLAKGDCLLLCTDGLSDLVSDEEIAELVSRSQNPQSACDALLNLALERGGRDNITVVIARIDELGSR
jgi:protein phosphatase